MEWADVLTAALGTGGAGALLFGIVKALLERKSTQTTKVEEDHALKAMAAPPIVGDALSTAQQALEMANSLSAKVAALERENGQRVREVRILISWVDNIRSNWDLHRARPRPPARPDINSLFEGGDQ